MYSFLCVFISQYSIKVDFISVGEAEMGGAKRGSPKLGEPRPPLPPLGAATDLLLSLGSSLNKVDSFSNPYFLVQQFNGYVFVFVCAMTYWSRKKFNQNFRNTMFYLSE